jgi:hypothetical protein
MPIIGCGIENLAGSEQNNKSTKILINLTLILVALIITIKLFIKR